MKIFFTLLITCFFGLNSLVAQTKSEIKTDRERESLHGAVKKVETYLVEFLSKDNAIVEQKRPWIINSFNPEGKLSERIVHIPDGNVNRDVYTYNVKGENVECKTFYSDFKIKNLTRVQTYVHTFDNRGNLIEREVFEDDGSRSTRFVYIYDAKGNKIEYRHYYHTGALGGKTVFIYNDNGKLLSQTYSNGNGSLIWRHLYAVNDKGQTIEDSTYIGETLRYRILFVYDDKERVVQQETLEFNAVPNQRTSHAPEPGKIIFVYDDQRNTKEEIKFNKNGFLEKAVLYVYDEKDNEIERVWYESGGSFDDLMRSKEKTRAAQKKLRGIFKGKITYRYEYDAQNNWTKKTRLYQSQENELPKSQGAEYRIISYY